MYSQIVIFKSHATYTLKQKTGGKKFGRIFSPDESEPWKNSRHPRRHKKT